MNTSPRNNRPRSTERVTFTGLFIILDFLLRLLVFDLWIYLRLSDALFWSLQAVVLTVLMLGLASWNYNRLLNKRRVKHMVVEAGPWALILVLFVVVSGAVVSYSATEDGIGSFSGSSSPSQHARSMGPTSPPCTCSAPPGERGSPARTIGTRSSTRRICIPSI